MIQLKQSIAKNNRTADLIEEGYNIYKEMLAPYVGKKLIKVDGSPIAKIGRVDKYYLKSSYTGINLTMRVREHFNDTWIDTEVAIGTLDTEGKLLTIELLSTVPSRLIYEDELVKYNRLHSKLVSIREELELLNYATSKVLKADFYWLR